MKIALIISAIYCFIGLIVLIANWKHIPTICREWKGTPFYQGFMLGLFRASIILVYPIYLYYKYAAKKLKKEQEKYF